MDLDDLDNALFGMSSSTKASISNMDSLFGDSYKAKPTTGVKPNVSFFDDKAAPKSQLDDLFGDSSKDVKPRTLQPAKPRTSRAQAKSSSVANANGVKQEVVPQQNPSTLIEINAQQPPSAETAVRSDNLRVQRLENEVERLNREIDDLKRKKKNDEEDMEQMWKDKLLKRENEHDRDTIELKANWGKQISKLKEEQEEELSRMKVTYERQLDALQSTVSNSRDLSGVVDRVDNISVSINKLASDVANSTNKSLVDRDTTLRLREQAIKTKEERLEEDRQTFEEEKLKVFQLNTRLTELCKDNEEKVEQGRWRVRDEWNRLNAEKHIYKEDQKYIADTLERQKIMLEKSKAEFLKEQHDLLIRVSVERAQLDHERNEFYGQRSLDIRRLKEEGIEMQHRLQAIESAEKQAEDMKWHYETKFAQLQELEVTLMEECVEMEKMRNQLKDVAMEHSTKLQQREPDHIMESKRHSRRQSIMEREFTKAFQKQDSVRTVLKKHSEFLEKYVGQKVATVAPQSVTQSPSPS